MRYSLLFIAMLLVACSTETKESRYKDLSALEQPPTLPSDPYQASASYGSDEGRINKAQSGLGANVYLVEGSPLQLRIKYPAEKSWYIVARALKDSDFKITDFDKAKKVFYVGYGESSGGIFGLFSSEPDQYLLAMKESGKETVVIATLLVDNSGSNGSDKDGYHEAGSGTNADQVLRKLYDVLHNDIEQ